MNVVEKLLELDHVSRQARRNLRNAQADITRVTARNTIRKAQEDRAELLVEATDDEFAAYIEARNRH